MSGFFKGFFKFLAVLVIAAAVVVCVIVLCVSKSQKDSEPSGSSNSAQTETVRTEKPRTSDKTEQSGKDDKDSSKPTEKPAASDGVDPDFRAAMDEYEAFIDEYVTFIKKYEEEGKPVSMLADYTKMMTQYSVFAAAMAEYESEELSDADAAYLIQVNARVQTKLLTLN